MKFLCGIDIGVRDSSVYVLMKYDEKDDKLYSVKQKELNECQKHEILSLYYQKPPRQKENISLGGGLCVRKEISDKAFYSIKQNYENNIILKVTSILELNNVINTLSIDFDRGTKRYNFKE